MKSKIIALAACLISAHSASAITLSDNNPADTWINILNPSYTGNFTLSPYNPLTQQVNSAFVEFTLWDGIVLGGAETWTLTLDGGAFSSGGSFSGFFNFGGAVTGSALVTLSDTGALSYTISRNSGEFWITNAYLEAEVGARGPGGANGVPDGGSTVLLLGAGLMGLAAVRRFVARAA
jgi:hypothetical protein